MTRRAKDLADTAASTLAVVASTVWRPIVHPWMLSGATWTTRVVRQLDDQIPRIEAVLRRAGTEPVATAATVDAVRSVREAFARLGVALETHGEQLRHLLRTRPVDLAAIRAETNALGEADARCRSALVAATRELPQLGDLLTGTPWAVTAAPQDREGLAGWTTVDVERAVSADAHLLDRLADDEAPAWLKDALEERCVHDDEPDHVRSLRRVARVREACAAQTDDALHRASLLHPRVMGGCDGVPVAVRVRANRLVMRADLRRMAALDLTFEDEVAAQHRQDSADLWRSAQGAALDAWLAKDELTALATVETDRATARQAELRQLVTLTQQLLHDRADQGGGRRGRRQVLHFSTDGHVVELLGRLDADTRQVAVYVGGTGTTVRNFGWPTGIARALLRDDPSGGTAVITWMGAEFPSAIGTHSPFGRFARAAAAPLRDCVEGLGVPDDVPITVIGHSYGGTIVGAAEALGLRADRVVHAGVPGIGPGVRSLQDYPTVDALGRDRRVTRYALTAPGDLIRLWRKGDAALASVTRFRFAPLHTAIGWVDQRILGADPMTLPGIVDLDPGIWEVDRDDRRAGEILFGPRGHADVVEPGTTSFRRICAVVRGCDPLEIAPPPGLVPFRWRQGSRRKD